MSIATLKLDESHKMEFGVSITGADGIPQTRFVIETGKYSISYPCSPTVDGVEVVLSELRNIVPAGTHAARLEVIIDNKLYVPFTDTITFEPVVEVKSAPKSVRKESKAVQETTVQSVQVGAVKVVKSSEDISTLKEDTKPMAMAKLVARNLSYTPTQTDITPEQLVNEALDASPALSSGRMKIVSKLLKLAEDAGVDYDKQRIRLA
jgi:hypothetical protein